MADQQQRSNDPRKQDDQHPYEENMENTQGNDFADATGPQDDTIERTVDEGDDTDLDRPIDTGNDSDFGRSDDDVELPDGEIGIPSGEENNQGGIDQGDGNLPTGTNDDPTRPEAREANMDTGTQYTDNR